MQYKTTHPLTEQSRGADFCPACGAQVKWIRLLSGRWICVDPEPVLYGPGGRDWLVTGRNFEADITKKCKIWRPGLLPLKLKKGYKPHAWGCERWAFQRRSGMRSQRGD